MVAADDEPDVHESQLSETRALVERVKQGDRERFGALFDRVAPALHPWAVLRTPPKLRSLVGPEDIVQEVWCRALVRFEGFDPDKARFRSWVFGIAKNVMLEVFKALRNRPVARGEGAESSIFNLDDMPAEATAVSRRVARDLGMKAFVDRLGNLSGEDQELLILRGLEGLSHESIAVHLDITADAAQKRWVRLRDRLRTEGIPEDMIED